MSDKLFLYLDWLHYKTSQCEATMRVFFRSSAPIQHSICRSAGRFSPVRGGQQGTSACFNGLLSLAGAGSAPRIPLSLSPRVHAHSFGSLGVGPQLSSMPAPCREVCVEGVGLKGFGVRRSARAPMDVYIYLFDCTYMIFTTDF